MHSSQRVSSPRRPGISRVPHPAPNSPRYILFGAGSPVGNRHDSGSACGLRDAEERVGAGADHRCDVARSQRLDAGGGRGRRGWERREGAYCGGVRLQDAALLAQLDALLGYSTRGNRPVSGVCQQWCVQLGAATQGCLTCERSQSRGAHRSRDSCTRRGREGGSTDDAGALDSHSDRRAHRIRMRRAGGEAGVGWRIVRKRGVSGGGERRAGWGRGGRERRGRREERTHACTNRRSAARCHVEENRGKQGRKGWGNDERVDGLCKGGHAILHAPSRCRKDPTPSSRPMLQERFVQPQPQQTPRALCSRNLRAWIEDSRLEDEGECGCGAQLRLEAWEWREDGSAGAGVGAEGERELAVAGWRLEVGEYQYPGAPWFLVVAPATPMPSRDGGGGCMWSCERRRQDKSDIPSMSRSKSAYMETSAFSRAQDPCGMAGGRRNPARGGRHRGKGWIEKAGEMRGWTLRASADLMVGEEVGRCHVELGAAGRAIGKDEQMSLPTLSKALRVGAWIHSDQVVDWMGASGRAWQESLMTAVSAPFRSATHPFLRIPDYYSSVPAFTAYDVSFIDSQSNMFPLTCGIRIASSKIGQNRSLPNPFNTLGPVSGLWIGFLTVLGWIFGRAGEPRHSHG
ncbi:hypothetical protein B0H11DRAFT_1921371 [Mycena galericulata]|nr:hypothetical protein B0H11DRAFT_1921371 [Mycena galericulata]